MITRFMRLILFFDLPTETPKNRRDYRKFRANLIKEGFIMLQESVYCKLAINKQTSVLILERIKKFIPPEGLVQVIEVTEKQFSKMNTLVGKNEPMKEIITTERLIII